MFKTALMAGVAGAMLSTSSAALAQEVTTVNFIMPTPRSILFYPMIVGEALGYFEDEGIEINLLPSATTVPFVAFLTNGSADIAKLDGPQTYQALNAGIPVSVIYEAQQVAPEGIVVPGDSPITSADQLVGKTVGLVSDRDRATLEVALNAVGANIEDVTTVVVGEGGPTLANAFTRGTVDAIAGALPDWIALQANGIEIRDITPEGVAETPANSFVILSERKEEMQDILEGFTRAWSKGAYASSLDRDALGAMTREAVPEEWQQEEFGWNFIDGATPLNTPVTEQYGALRPEAWEKVQAQMIEVGELTAPIDVSTFLDDSFIGPANDFNKEEVAADLEEWKQANGM